MNPRQRRGVALLVVSVIGAGGVFGAVSSYTASVARQLGPTRPVLTLRHDVEAYQSLRRSDFELDQVPEMFAPGTQLSGFEDLLGRVPAVALSKGARVEDDLLVDRPSAADGEREVTVQVGVEAGVAAALLPDDQVDVIAAYKASGDRKAYARTVIGGARILRVTELARSGVSGEITAGADDADALLRGDTELAVTFALEPKQVNAVVLAQTTASTLRLALQPRGVLPTAEKQVPRARPKS